MLVKFQEPLTSESCCKLILELVKYLLYQKQQIPVTYEYLLSLGASSAGGASDRCFTTARGTLACLQNISDHLSAELSRGSGVVKEIAISMGATILSPKLCVRVSLPLGILNGRSHRSQQHPTRKPLLSLMRSITESREFQEAMTLPLSPTNTFILVQKSDSNRVSEFFLPKPRYALPTGTAGSRFHIQFCDQDQYDWDCDCGNAVRVYQDSDSSCSDLATSQSMTRQNSPEGRLAWCEDSAYQWYQSRDVIKGFKFSR